MRGSSAPAPVLAIVAVGMVMAVGGCGSSGASHTTSASAAPSPRVLAIIKHSFGVFRRPARANDQIPTVQAVGAIKPSLSRLIYSGPLGTFYAYAENALVCISYTTAVGPRGGGSGRGGCESVDAVRTFGAAAPIPASFDRLDRLAMLVADGVSRVTVTRANGTTANVNVVENGMVYATSGLRAWAFTTPAGVRRTGTLRSGSTSGPVVPPTGAAGKPPAGGASAVGPASAQVQAHVQPAQGTPGTTFGVGMTVRAVLGPHQGLVTSYRVTVARSGAGGAPRPGCGAAPPASLTRGAIGPRQTVLLRPGSGGWCPGAYHGVVTLQSAPPCPPATAACPPPNQSAQVGQFDFRVA